MRIAELWRYPVKSLLGERLDAVTVTADGLEGDRQFAIYDAQSGLGLTARRVPELLFASARMRADGTAEITLPDGSTAANDDALSDWLGRSVTLRSVTTKAARRYENVVDFEHESTSDWESFDGAASAFHDSPDVQVSLVSTATIGTWDPRRFRANVLFDGEGEDSLVGSTVTLGEVTLDVGMRIKRCVMTTRAQAGGIERDLDVLRTIARDRGACLAVGAHVIVEGTISVGDAVGATSQRVLAVVAASPLSHLGWLALTLVGSERQAPVQDEQPLARAVMEVVGVDRTRLELPRGGGERFTADALDTPTADASPKSSSSAQTFVA